MANQSVNEFYIRFLFKIYALPQDIAFPLEIAATFFNNLSTEVRELLMSEGVQVHPKPPNEKNHQENQRFLLVINAAVEAEKTIRKIKMALQPASRICNLKTLMGILAENPST